MKTRKPVSQDNVAEPDVEDSAAQNESNSRC